MPGGRTKLPTALAIASEGVLTLIGVSVINPFSRDLAEASTPFTGGVRLRRNPSARQPSGEGCYLGGTGPVVVSALLACPPAGESP